MKHALTLALLLLSAALPAWNALLGPLEWGDEATVIRQKLNPLTCFENSCDYNHFMVYVLPLACGDVLVDYTLADGLTSLLANIEIDSPTEICAMFDSTYVFWDETTIGESLLTQEEIAAVKELGFEYTVSKERIVLPVCVPLNEWEGESVEIFSVEDSVHGHIFYDASVSRFATVALHFNEIVFE